MLHYAFWATTPKITENAQILKEKGGLDAATVSLKDAVKTADIRNTFHPLRRHESILRGISTYPQCTYGDYRCGFGESAH